MSGWFGSPEIKEASEYTKKLHKEACRVNGEYYDRLEDYELEQTYKHSILDYSKTEMIKDKDGKILRRRDTFDLQEEKDIPDTVHPNLWRHGRTNRYSGIVSLVDGKCYATCGLIGSTVCFIRSNTGWIFIDAAFGLDGMNFALDELETKLEENIRGNVKAVILSHPHSDMYAGVAALVKPEEVGSLAEGKIPVIGPGPWEVAKDAEYIGSGNSMQRRMMYQFGYELEKSDTGRYGGCLDWDMITGAYSYQKPTIETDEDEIYEIDGVKIHIVQTPDTETKAHMCVYIENYQLLYLADNNMDTIHNVQNLRGIQVRDAAKWGDAFYKLAVLYGDRTQVTIGGHGHPHWNTEEYPNNVKDFLLNEAAYYKYTNDQALHYANMGVNINELNSVFKIPDTITHNWYLRQHYGSYTFNARAVIQKYLGFYDGHPIHLNPLPRSEHAKKLIAYVGSAEIIMKKAKADFEKGEYQWVTEITSELVFADPQNSEARFLCADAFEQLGYQQENTLWRNAYLTAAYELRDIESCKRSAYDKNDNYGSSKVLKGIPVSMRLDRIGIALDGSRAGNEDVEFLLEIVDADGEVMQHHSVHFFKGAMLHYQLEDDQQLPSVIRVRTDEEGLEWLEVGKTEEIKKHFDAEGVELILHLASYITDFSEYERFEIIT